MGGRSFDLSCIGNIVGGGSYVEDGNGLAPAVYNKASPPIGAGGALLHIDFGFSNRCRLLL